MISRDDQADAVIAEARRRKLSEPKPPMFSEAELEAGRAEIAAARELALPLIESVRGCLSDQALWILDTYAAADEWEIIIGLTTGTAVAEGIPVPPEVLEYADEIDESIVEQLRQRFAGSV